MDESIRQKILEILGAHRIMMIATLRPDGWPQATAVGYANDGLTLYFCCGNDSQKSANLLRDDRLTLTVGNDPDQVMEINALSMAAHAKKVEDPDELESAFELLKSKYPWQEGTPAESPPEELTNVFRVTPEVISVIDYTKGFAHTDLVHC